MSKLTISNMQEHMRADMLEVLVDAFGNEFQFYTKTKAELTSAYSHIFCQGQFFVAHLDDLLVGILGASTINARACSFDYSTVRSALGTHRAQCAALDIEQELNFSLPLAPDTAFLEYIATKKSARGQGIATALIQYALTLPYRHFLLEVYQSNQPAINLYKKLGFVQTNTPPILPFGNNKLVMEYKK